MPGPCPSHFGRGAKPLFNHPEQDLSILKACSSLLLGLIRREDEYEQPSQQEANSLPWSLPIPF